MVAALGRTCAQAQSYAGLLLACLLVMLWVTVSADTVAHQALNDDQPEPILMEHFRNMSMEQLLTLTAAFEGMQSNQTVDTAQPVPLVYNELHFNATPITPNTSTNSHKNYGQFRKKESLLEGFWAQVLIWSYSLTAICALVLNLGTIFVLAHSERAISTELWRFLVNLSVADIGMAIFCIPFTYTEVMFQNWIFPSLLCPVVNFAQLCSVRII